MGDGLVQRRGHEGELQPHAPALEVVEAGAADLGAPTRVDDVQSLAERQVVGRREALGGEVAGGRALVAQDDVVLLTAGRCALDEVGELAGELVEGGGGPVRGGLGLLDASGELPGPGENGRALSGTRLADGSGDGLLLGAQRLEVLQAGAAGLVSLDDPVDEGDVGAAGSLTGAVGLGILAKRAQIDHGTSVVRAPHRASGGPM